MKTCTMVDSIYEKWCLLLSKVVEAEPHYSTLGKTVKYAWGLIQTPGTKVNIKFLVAFEKFYWKSGYNWLRRNDSITRLDAHISHEVLVQVFIIKYKIQ